MSKNYLSLAEAAALTNRSEMTIRRLLKKAESKPFVRISTGNKAFIQEEYVRHVFALDDPMTQNHQVLTAEWLKTLAKEYPTALLAEKDKRIETLTQTIAQKDNTIRELIHTNQQLIESNNQLIERSRESNIIIQSLQQNLQQTAGKLPNANVDQHKMSKGLSATDRSLYVMASLASVLMGIIIIAIVYSYFKNA